MIYILKDENQKPRQYVEKYDEGFRYTHDINAAKRFESADHAISWLLTWTYASGHRGGGYASGLRPVQIVASNDYMEVT